MIRRSLGLLGLVAALLLLSGTFAAAALEVLDAVYHPDRMLPEWNYFYSSSYRPGDVVPDRVQGGHIYVYLYNNGTGSVTVSDFTINGMGLVAGLKCYTDKTYRCDLYACSVYYPYVKQTLVDAGEPVWWRVEPSTIPAGGVGEVVVRMRRTVAGTLACGVVAGSTIPLSIPVSATDGPRVMDHFYDAGGGKLYLYVRHPVSGKIPTAVYVDQTNVTSNCTFAADPNLDVVAIRVSPSPSLARGTYHVFRAVYDDGTKASFGLRVYSDGFKYGTWGCPDLPTWDAKRAHLLDLVRHSVNLLTMGTGDLSDFLKDAEGKAIMDQYGIKKSHEDKTADRLYSIFTCDEPDCGEPNVADSVAPNKPGSLAQCMIHTIRDNYRGSYAIYPTTVNIDGTNQPYAWYNWGQVADHFQHDGYWIVRLRDAYASQPWRIPFFSKCTWRYASAATAKAACEPRRLQIIIDFFRNQRDGAVFRWATPAEQHIMAYYSIAAGAKEISYWWLTEIGDSTDGSNGLTEEPGSQALWREVGLIGAELGTVGSLIVNSSPVQLPITAPGRLWTRALISGTDTIMLVCTNDDYVSDDAGAVLRPIHNVNVSFNLPGWLSSPTDVFEVDYRGVRDVSRSITDGRISMNLGRVDVARLLIVTKDGTLKSSLQSLYSGTYGPRVAQLIPLP